MASTSRIPAKPQQNQRSAAVALNEFEFEIPFADYLRQHYPEEMPAYYTDECKHTAIFEEFIVGDRDVVFDVEVTVKYGNGTFTIKLIRRSQRMSAVYVDTCDAVTKNMYTFTGNYEAVKPFQKIKLIAGSDVLESSTVPLTMMRIGENNTIVSESNPFAFYAEQSLAGHRFMVPKTFVPNEARIVIIGTITCRLKSSTMPSELRTLLNDSETSDVEIIVGENKFVAHKLLLATRSSFFKGMFNCDMKEKIENVFKLPKEDPKVFEQVLHYIYTDACPELSTMIDDILVAADKYDLQGLRVICENEMEDTMSVENVCHYLQQSEMFNSKQIYDLCVDFILNNREEVTKSAAWIALHDGAEYASFMADVIEKMNK